MKAVLRFTANHTYACRHCGAVVLTTGKDDGDGLCCLCAVKLWERSKS